MIFKELKLSCLAEYESTRYLVRFQHFYKWLSLYLLCKGFKFLLMLGCTSETSCVFFMSFTRTLISVLCFWCSCINPCLMFFQFLFILKVLPLYWLMFGINDFVFCDATHFCWCAARSFEPYTWGETEIKVEILQSRQVLHKAHYLSALTSHILENVEKVSL